ncbi:MAG: hypothetical protein WKF94_09875 [Solirubrobacteraceae bacterium]
MGRGGGETTWQGQPAPALRSALADTVARRLRGWDSIRLARVGRLQQAEAGHPAGTPFVVIEADDAMNREIASNLLREHSATTDLAWEFGWTGRINEAGKRVSELTLYAHAAAAYAG